MFKAVMRSLLAHKTRLALTALSVVVGVAFVSGIYIYTDTTNDAFDDVFATAYEGIDIHIAAESEFTMGEGGAFDESVTDDVAAIDGVSAVEPALFGMGVQILDQDGETIGQPGPPQFGVGVAEGSGSVSTGTVLREGRIPAAPNEIVVDATSAETGEFVIGDDVSVITPASPRQTFELVGIVGFGDNQDNLGGATFAIFEMTTAQELMGRPGMISEISVGVDEGTDVDAVISAISEILPENAKAQTAEAAAEEQSEEIKEALSFIRTFLLVFGFIALFVGSFIIYNTFRIVITQRMRELALLRAIGSTRAQVLRSVLLEAIVVGLVSSAIGVIAGIGLALGMRALLDAIGVALPTGSLIIAPRTVFLGIGLGTAVTTLSAIIPAFAASRVPPIAAMRDDAVAPPPRTLRIRAAIGTLLVVGGGLLIIGGLNQQNAEAAVVLGSVGTGALLMIIGAYALSAVIARPVAAVIGAPFGWLFNLTGRLAQRNAGRSPRRTAATSGAIMVGIALIALASVLSASIRATVDDLFSTGVEADAVITPTDAFGLTGYTPALAQQVGELPEVADVTRIPLVVAMRDGTETFVTAIDDNYADFFTIETIDGERTLQSGNVLVSATMSERNDWAVGDAVDLTFEATGPQQFTIGGTYESDAVEGILLARTDLEANVTVPTDSQVYIQFADGVSEEDGVAAVEAVAAEVPTAQVQTLDELAESLADQVDMLLNMITGLLGMTVFVALIGVTNTMALAVFERTKEIGLLRAVGLGRRQTRRMIRYEASIISMFGALIGVALGLFFGWAVIRALSSEGFSSFVIPWMNLASWVLILGVLGVVFAWWPARRASRLNVLDAISHD